ncbi:MAG TPA: glycyl-radical enzyme activating protein [Geobacteraceae bacterium]|nr:glycyl-radical enzyme activating protein [Geobacteraceae bacterium]
MSWTSQFQLYDPDAWKRAELTGLVTDFQKFSIHDGPGIRTIVFLKGCPLHCRWCSNPETIFPRPEIMLIPHNCIGCGRCMEECPQKCIDSTDDRVAGIDREKCLLPECGRCQRICNANAINISGRFLTVAQVMEVVERDREFYERTGGGVTFSGGEPFAQPNFLRELALAAKTRHLHTAVETCGFATWETIESVLGFLDLFLFDIKHMDPERHLCGTGVPNVLILENLKRIDTTGTPIRVRLPLIPGFNDSDDNMRATASFAAGLASLQALDILPYHRMGEPKWGQLDRTYALHGVPPHGREQIFALADIAREYGIEVTVGG